MASKLPLSRLALAIAGLGWAMAASAGLGPIHVLSSDGDAFVAEIPVMDDEPTGNVLVNLADRNHYPLLSAYSGSASALQFSITRKADGNVKKIVVRGPAAFSEPLLRFAVELSWPAGRLVREFEVDYRRDGPPRKTPAPANGDDGKKHAATPDNTARLDGLGLGELKVKSRLGEPLLAELALLGGALDKTDQLQVMLAADGAAADSKEQLALIASISHQLIKTPSGGHVLQLQSSQPVVAPVLTFRLDVAAAGLKAQKSYTLLLDAHGGGAVSDQARAGKAARAVKEPVKQYRVRKGDSLSEIASRMRGYPRETDVAQLLLQRNPQAFIGGDANKLKADVDLSYPAGWSVSEPAPGNARQASAEKPAASPAAAPVSASKAAASEPAKAPPVSPAVRAAEQKMRDVLARQDHVLEQTEARARALEERIRQLQQSRAQAAVASQPKAQPKVVAVASQPAATLKPMLNPLPAAEASRPEARAATIKPAAPSSPRHEASQPRAALAHRPEGRTPPAEVSAVDEALGMLSDSQVQLQLGGAAAALALVAVLLRRRKRHGASGAVAGPDGSADKPAGHSMFTLGPLTTLMSTLKKGDGIDISSVDRIAEAEVYLAYGRSDQALDILREGLNHEPMRQDLRYKLLEVLADQPDAAAFIAEAGIAQSVFGKDSTQWQRVSELGRRVAPGHPLFVEAEPPAAPLAKTPVAEPKAEMPLAGTLAGLGFETPAQLKPETPPVSPVGQAAVVPEEADDKVALAKLYLEMGDKETADALMQESRGR